MTKIEALLEAKLETKLSARDRKLSGRISVLERKMDARFEHLGGRVGVLDARFKQFEGKLDGFIETQSEFNRLIDARLRRLET